MENMMEKIIARPVVENCPCRASWLTGLPQARNGVIDVSLLIADNDKITIRADRWDHIAAGDTLVGYFDSTATQPNIIDDTSQSSYDVGFEPSEIPNGTYNAWYSVVDTDGNCRRSLAKQVTIINSRADTPSAPIFPAADDGVLFYSSITEYDGTPIRAEYASIASGDTVTFYWTGFDANGNPVPSAAYTSDPLSVKDASKGYIDGAIPAANILSLGNLGMGVAWYEVKTQADKTFTSLDTQVETSWTDIRELQVSVTNGAAHPSDDYPHLRPCNHGTIFGPPGWPVTASVTTGAVIAEATGKDPTTYQTILDKDGLAHFRVSSQTESLITVVASSATLAGASPVANMTFDEYYDGSAGIEGYNYSTHAPSDGVTPCSICAVVVASLKTDELTVTVDGGARIKNADPENPQTRDVPLNDDGSASVDITDTTAETVNVTMFVRGQPGPPVKFSLQFVTFPPPP